ncbi:MAG: apolipoprotein N-acyltransferase [Candidatus Omnitrophica bacterium]|nr:apolipoprotein N-acyltransferase [Candidatus Omnitrophota bacterium]MDD5236319.1 apolipoprotein N-acyltransferase [Candidatus Omnitrophota bacterium]MDD5610808.1 apolipoprotein N-acyltransferase [Candidatus Omnitrophota bacterium]
MLRQIIFSTLSAILLILSFPSFNLWPLAWFAFLPLFSALRDKKALTRFLWAYLTGVIFFFGTMYWLVHVTLAGMIALVLYLALFFGVFGLFFSPRLATAGTLFFLPAAWVLLEYVRGHLLTGLGWVLLGHSQYTDLAMVQISDITGAYGVSFLIILVNVSIWQIINRGKGVRGRELLVAAACLALTLGYGVFRLHQKIDGKKLRISVIQGNIPQELKWVRNEKETILEKHLALSMEASGENPDLILWSETSLPVVLEDEKELLSAVSSGVRKLQRPVLTGTVRREKEDYYNSAVLFSPDGKIIRHYDKIHLVPFGEYIPLRKPFVFLERLAPIGDFTAGKDYTLFEVRNSAGTQNKFAVLICFEDIFPELARRFRQKGAEFLVNVTNDAWFGKTSAPFQHLQSSVFRAIENRVPVARSANTGVSGFISNQGRILSLVKNKRGENTYISGYATQEIEIPADKRSTFYTRFGDIFVLLCLLIFIYGIIILRPKHV